MTVEVIYQQRFGNNLFQYVFARLFAEHTGLRLVTPLVENRILFVKEPSDGLEVEGPEVCLLDCKGVDPFLEKHPPAKYICSGFFQRALWYYKNREKILSYFRYNEISVNKKDLVVNIRGGDYFNFKRGWVIDPIWYLDIIARENFETLYIVTDDVTGENNRKILSSFDRYRPVVVHFEGEPEKDFNFLRSFDRMVMANSSFSWWAGFFSEGSRFYTHKRWIDCNLSDFFPKSMSGEPLSNLAVFPKSIPVDGPFLGEISV